MNSTLVGLATFGNLKYTKITIESIIENTEREVDFFVVVGKPWDKATAEWLTEKKIPFVAHTKNMGFPYSVNDIYDYAWVHNDYDNLIIVGNDIYAYPTTVDSLIDLAEKSDYEVISALQYDVRSLYSEYEETRELIDRRTHTVLDLTTEPWKKFTGWGGEQQIADMSLYDIQNMCLYKKEVFKKIGYTDVNFFPAYFIDNDYARRLVKANIKVCSLVNARFFHFWSRTLKEETGASNTGYFRNNEKYYKSKWGGVFGKETRVPELGIFSREHEEATIDTWRKVSR